MKKLKLAVLVLLFGMLSGQVFANQARLSDLAFQLESDARNLMRTLAYKVGRYHSAYRQAHALYHAAQNFSQRCYGVVRLRDAQRSRYYQQEFARIQARFSRLRRSIAHTHDIDRSKSIRRHFRRVESSFYVLRNSFNARHQTSDYDDAETVSLNDY